MSTIKEWLSELNYDWADGLLIIHPTEGNRPGRSDLNGNAAWYTGSDSRDAELVNHEFNDGFGAPECPRFIAYDKKAVYFPSQYDGATQCEKVYLNPHKYLDGKTDTPYPWG